MEDEFGAIVHPQMDGSWIQLKKLLNRCKRHGSALSVAVLAGQSASAALGNPESNLQYHNGSVASARFALHRNIAPGSEVSLSKLLRLLRVCG